MKNKKTCDPCASSLETKFIAFTERYEEKHKELVGQNNIAHEAILKQTTRTNGTVADLVKNDIEERTAIKIISIIVVPVFLYIIYRIIDVVFAKINLVS